MKVGLLLILSCLVALTYGQNVGINGTGAAPDASSILDVSSNDKGMLIPRIALIATNIPAPVVAPTISLMVYNTSTNGSGVTSVSPGFYYWNGTEWEKVISGNSISATDDQNLTGATLSGTNLQINIENGTSATVDLSGIQDGTGTDNQNLSLMGNNLSISGGNSVTLQDNVNDADFVVGNEYNTGASLSGTTLSVTDAGGAQTVSLSSLVDHDWYEVGGTSQPNSINDDIYTQGDVGIGVVNPARALEVNGHIRMSGGDRILESSNGFIDLRPNDAAHGIIIRDYTGGSTVWGGLRMVNSGTDYFHITANSTNTSEGIAVSDNGNVGIGVVTPTEKLHVNGEARIINKGQAQITDSIVFRDANGVLKQMSVARFGDYISQTYGSGSSTFKYSRMCTEIGTSNRGERANKVIETSDGGFLIVGECYFASSGTNDLSMNYVANVYAVKLDNNSDIQWVNEIGGSGNDKGYGVVELADGSFIICGTSNSYGQGGYDAYFVRLLSNGSFSWGRTLGGNGNEAMYDIIVNSNSEIICTGSTSSYGSGGDNIYVVKFNSTGTSLISTSVYGANDDDIGKSIIETSDGGYAVGGSTNDGDNSFILKLTTSFTYSWSRACSYDGGGFDILETIDNSLVLASTQGASSGGGYENYHLVKYSLAGSKIWEKIIKSDDTEYLSSLIELTDGSLVLTGTQIPSNNTFGSREIVTVKLSNLAELQWSHRMTGGTSYGSSAKNIILTSDNRLAIVGYRYKTFNGNIHTDMIFNLMEINGLSCCGSGTDIQVNNAVLSGNSNYFSSSSSSGGILGTGGSSLGNLGLIIFNCGF